MKDMFQVALEFVFKHEGGYVNDPDDPGGETKYGISKRSYPHLDIKSLTKEDAAKIYKRDYWDKIGGDHTPTPLDVVLFDTAVNCGVGRATRWLGMATCWQDYLFLRLKHYAKLGKAKYLRGWLNRTIELHAYARKAIRGDIPQGGKQ